MRIICLPPYENLSSNLLDPVSGFVVYGKPLLVLALSFLLKCKVQNTELFLGMKPGGQSFSHIERRIFSLAKVKNETFGSL
jgi:hypothetical protein